MKIAIISAARTRSTALTFNVKNKYSLPCNYEIYTKQIKMGKTIEEITTFLFNQDKFIVKILGHNVIDNLDLNKFNLYMYDKIYFIERQNFLDQACSLQLCYDTNLYLNFKKHRVDELYRELSTKHYVLKYLTIKYLAKDIANYMMLKKNVIKHNIPFEQYFYETCNFTHLDNILSDPKLNYSQIISNYNDYNINKIFYNYFNYTSLEHNYNKFCDEVYNLYGADNRI